nr:MAG TPA: hypothetical protein [Caudoviricetes sp.]
MEPVAIPVHFELLISDKVCDKSQLCAGDAVQQRRIFCCDRCRENGRKCSLKVAGVQSVHEGERTASAESMRFCIGDWKSKRRCIPADQAGRRCNALPVWQSAVQDRRKSALVTAAFFARHIR